MVNTGGGPCLGLKKRPRQHHGDQEPAQLCAAVSSHRWYGGPTCKNCYERNKTERNNQPKMAKTDDAPAESGGDIPLVCLRVSAARCALPPVAPALSPPACFAIGRASDVFCGRAQNICHPTGAGGPEQPSAGVRR